MIINYWILGYAIYFHTKPYSLEPLLEIYEEVQQQNHKTDMHRQFN